MKSIEFQATIKGNSIEVPPEWTAELSDGDVVKVILKKEEAGQAKATGIIAELLENPIEFSGRPFSREEIYDRKL
ncbi:MAG: hypothetical protein JOZ78_04065 [Chroococcidiopsidaceae cyanobacterium CP_BM_ER_R8_30]|nr:hypothetical protein [Chroococcidiopsidaceae cyanobacterium CP_BM_ER_R8_30]